MIRSLCRGGRWENGCILYIIPIFKSDERLSEPGVVLFSPSVAASRKLRLKCGASGSDVYYFFSIISSINPLKWGVYLILPTSLLLACAFPGASLPLAPWTVLCCILGGADAAGFAFCFVSVFF